MKEYQQHIQTKARPLQQLGDPAFISRQELAAARRAIANYKLRDNFSYFKKRK